MWRTYWGEKPMSARKVLCRLPLLALAPLAFALPGFAYADQQQYVVAYFEFLPASKEVGAVDSSNS